MTATLEQLLAALVGAGLGSAVPTGDGQAQLRSACLDVQALPDGRWRVEFACGPSRLQRRLVAARVRAAVSGLDGVEAAPARRLVRRT